jgi:hypothetical membrane protein
MSAESHDRRRPPPDTGRWMVAAGGACWSLLVVFFVGQAVAQAAVVAPYSLLDNNISDLGATTCGPIAIGDYRSEVCSPWHPVMNTTFVVSGLLTLLGALLTRDAWPAGRRRSEGLALLVGAGLGEALAGLFPEDVHAGLHVAGSVVGILGLLAGVLLLGTAVRRTRPWLSGGALAAGAVGLFGFFVAPAVGVPAGLAERLAGYPGVLWLIAAGAGLLLAAVRGRERPAERVRTAAADPRAVPAGRRARAGDGYDLTG